jgi:hypothetical protein
MKRPFKQSINCAYRLIIPFKTAKIIKNIGGMPFVQPCSLRETVRGPLNLSRPERQRARGRLFYRQRP